MRERESKQEDRGAEGEGEKESQAGPMPSVESDTGLNLMTWAEIQEPPLNWLSHPGNPLNCI